MKKKERNLILILSGVATVMLIILLVLHSCGGKTTPDPTQTSQTEQTRNTEMTEPNETAMPSEEATEPTEATQPTTEPPEPAVPPDTTEPPQTTQPTKPTEPPVTTGPAVTNPTETKPLEVVLETVAVLSEPNKTAYFVGEDLDTSGLRLIAAYSDGREETVQTGFTCTPTKLSAAGTQEIEVFYGGKSVTFHVTVTEVAISGLSVKSMPKVTSFNVGDTLDPTGLVLSAIYNDGTEEEITEGYSASPIQLSEAGTQSITVTYKGLSASFTIQVKEVILDSGSCGDNLTWKLTNDYVLTISGSGAMNAFSNYSQVPWRSYTSEIKAIRLSDELASIGSFAFYNCLQITEVTIPNKVESVGSYAFAQCTDLTSISIPDSVSKLGSDVFRNDSNLTVVKFGKGLSSIGSDVFSNCDSLTGVWVDPSNQHYVSDEIGTLFNQDKTSLIVFPRNYSGTSPIPGTVKNIANFAFKGCDLTGVVIPESVTNIYFFAFMDCDSLTTVTISAGVQNVFSSSFKDCDNLRQVYVMNSNCDLAEDEGTLGGASTTTIYGYAGSTAQTYAEKYGYAFVII